MGNMSFIDSTSFEKEDDAINFKVNITKEMLGQYLRAVHEINSETMDGEEALKQINSPEEAEHILESLSRLSRGEVPAETTCADLAEGYRMYRTIIIAAMLKWLESLEKENHELAEIMLKRYTSDNPDKRKWSTIERELYGTYGGGEFVRKRVYRYWKLHPDGILMSICLTCSSETTGNCPKTSG